MSAYSDALNRQVCQNAARQLAKEAGRAWGGDEQDGLHPSVMRQEEQEQMTREGRVTASMTQRVWAELSRQILDDWRKDMMFASGAGFSTTPTHIHPYDMLNTIAPLGGNTASTDGFDPVQRPAHYASGDIECIEAIRVALGPEGFAAYCRGNVIKYLWRTGKKDSAAQDAEKAAWYASKHVEAVKVVKK